MEEPKWYVAHTFSGYENKVASNILTVVENRNLHDLIFEVAIPTETVKELKSNHRLHGSAREKWQASLSFQDRDKLLHNRQVHSL